MKNIEQLKKEFTKKFPFLKVGNTKIDENKRAIDGVHFIRATPVEDIFDFFLPHLLQHDEKKQVFCSLINHPDGVDCYGQKILTQEQYNLRGINTEPICQLITPSNDEIEREIINKAIRMIFAKRSCHRHEPEDCLICSGRQEAITALTALRELLTQQSLDKREEPELGGIIKDIEEMKNKYEKIDFAIGDWESMWSEISSLLTKNHDEIKREAVKEFLESQIEYETEEYAACPLCEREFNWGETYCPDDGRKLATKTRNELEWGSKNTFIKELIETLTQSKEGEE